MPVVDVIFYKEGDSVPVLEWLSQIEARDRRIRVKCETRIEHLHNMGHELRRPAADYLRDDIYELRVGYGSVNYRILYFFYGRKAVVLAHGLTKEEAVPEQDINIAIERRKKFAADPIGHQEAAGENDGENE